MRNSNQGEVMSPEIAEMIESLKNEGATLDQAKVVVDSIEGLSDAEKSAILCAFPPPLPPPPLPPPFPSAPTSVLRQRADQFLRIAASRPLVIAAGLAGFSLLALLLFALIGVSGNAAKIIGRWRSVGGDSSGFIEFFADGKMIEGDSDGQLVGYRFSGNRLEIGDVFPVGIEPPKIVVSFPDAEHMDWIIEHKGKGPAVTKDKAAAETRKRTVRFERVKAGQSARTKP
jgi:hypothetical protein